MTDTEIKRLMKTLEESINETMSESTKITTAIRSIKDAGYEVFFTIDATIAYDPRVRAEVDAVESTAGTEEPVRLQITQDDAKFLKSLKIAVDH